MLRAFYLQLISIYSHDNIFLVIMYPLFLAQFVTIQIVTKKYNFLIDCVMNTFLIHAYIYVCSSARACRIYIYIYKYMRLLTLEVLLQINLFMANLIFLIIGFFEDRSGSKNQASIEKKFIWMN